MRILRLLSSRPLPCGCLAGIYETYDGPIAWVVDVCGDECHDPGHRPGATLSHAERADQATIRHRPPSSDWTR
jgi:hypothetical protein